jgi:hypothetical protein
MHDRKKYLHHDRDTCRVNAFLWSGQQLFLGDHERVIEAVHVLEAAVDDGLHEPRAIVGALDAGLPCHHRADEAAGERAVIHQRPGQRRTDHLRRPGSIVPAGGGVLVAEHVQRPHRVAKARHAVDRRQLERLGRRRRLGRRHDEGLGYPCHGDVHHGGFGYVQTQLLLTALAAYRSE